MKRRNFLKMVCASPLAGWVKAHDEAPTKELPGPEEFNIGPDIRWLDAPRKSRLANQNPLFASTLFE